MKVVWFCIEKQNLLIPVALMLIYAHTEAISFKA